jgi:hypothetical protein
VEALRPVAMEPQGTDTETGRKAGNMSKTTNTILRRGPPDHPQSQTSLKIHLTLPPRTLTYTPHLELYPSNSCSDRHSFSILNGPLQCFNPSKNFRTRLLKKKEGEKNRTGNGIAVFRIENMGKEKCLEVQLEMGIMTSKFLCSYK